MVHVNSEHTCKLLLESLCSVYQLCQLSPARQHQSQNYLCLWASGGNANTVYTVCPPLKWDCIAASSKATKAPQIPLTRCSTYQTTMAVLRLALSFITILVQDQIEHFHMNLE